MNKYKNGKIYKIVSQFTDNIYIGSTTRTLSARKAEHKHDYKRNKKTLSCELVKLGAIKLELLENYACNSVEELEDREYYYMSLLPNVINKKKQKWDRQRYEDENREKINKMNREWKERNKEKEDIWRKMYRDWKKSWGGDYRLCNNMTNIKMDLFS